MGLHNDDDANERTHKITVQLVKYEKYVEYDNTDIIALWGEGGQAEDSQDHLLIGHGVNMQSVAEHTTSLRTVEYERGIRTHNMTVLWDLTNCVIE